MKLIILLGILPCLIQGSSISRELNIIQDVFAFDRQPAITPTPPPHTEPAKLARYIVHYSEWASMATISARDPTKGFPFSNVISISDGFLNGNSTGIPYMYVTDMEMSIHDLHVDNRVSLSMSLAQGDFCKKNGLDPEDPPCARVILTGSMAKLDKDSEEGQFAKKVLFARHPNFSGYPPGHMFYFARVNVEHVCVLGWYGGAVQLTTEEYFNATPTA